MPTENMNKDIDGYGPEDNANQYDPMSKFEGPIMLAIRVLVFVAMFYGLYYCMSWIYKAGFGYYQF